MRIQPGFTHAFVGPSGYGTTSTMRLIEPLYVVNSDVVTIDGRDVRQLNLRGYVGQIQSSSWLLSLRTFRTALA